MQKPYHTTPAASPPDGPGPAVATIRILTSVLCAAFILAYVVVAALRLRYPFELEWLEGAAVDHVGTVLSGRPLYAQPSLTFTPLTYTPGYFYLAAAVSAVTGPGFLPLRLISIAASVGVLLLIYHLVYRDTRDRGAGLLAAGLFAAMYGWTGAWFDLGRTDSLMLLLALAAIAVLRWKSTAGAAAAAGVLISLCFLTKQTGAIIAVPLALWCLSIGWRPFVSFTATVAVLVYGSTLALDRSFDGWYVYYVFSVPAQHPLRLDMLWGFWRFDLLRPLPIALLVSVLSLLWRVRHERRAVTFEVAAALALCGGAWASRLHSLSYVNVAIPAYAAVAMLFARSLHHAAMAIRQWAPGTRRQLVGAALHGLALVQLLHLRYDPRPLVPTAQDVATGHRFVERLAAMPGWVLVPNHGYLQTMAGKPENAHAVVMADVIRGGTSGVDAQFEAELVEALRQHRFASVIRTDGFSPVAAWLPIDQYYRPAEVVVSGSSRFWRTETRYVPR